jgi:hypothetical protein
MHKIEMRTEIYRANDVPSGRLCRSQHSWVSVQDRRAQSLILSTEHTENLTGAGANYEVMESIALVGTGEEYQADAEV